MIVAALLATIASTQDSDPTTAPKPALSRGSDLFCEARTPAGDTLGLVLTPFYAPQQTLMMVVSRDDQSWPGKGKGLLAVGSGIGDTLQFALGPDIEIRIEKYGSIRTLTFWSKKGGHIQLPVGFGYCSSTKVSSDTPLAAADVNPFDEARWQQQCFLTSPQSPEIRSTISWKYSDEADTVQMDFSSADARLFADGARAIASIGRLGTLTENPDIAAGVSKFAPPTDSSGPQGKVVGLVDKADNRSILLVSFSHLNKIQEKGFAICAAAAKAEGSIPFK